MHKTNVKQYGRINCGRTGSMAKTTRGLCSTNVVWATPCQDELVTWSIPREEELVEWLKRTGSMAIITRGQTDSVGNTK